MLRKHVHRSDTGLIEYMNNNENLQKLNVKLMKRIIELEKHRNIYADTIVALDNFIQEKEKYEALMKGGFSHECPFWSLIKFNIATHL